MGVNNETAHIGVVVLENMITVKVEMVLTGIEVFRVVHVEVERSETVGGLMSKIADKEGWPVENQQLFLNGACLEDSSASLADLKVDASPTVTLVLDDDDDLFKFSDAPSEEKEKKEEEEEWNRCGTSAQTARQCWGVQSAPIAEHEYVLGLLKYRLRHRSKSNVVKPESTTVLRGADLARVEGPEAASALSTDRRPGLFIAPLATSVTQEVLIEFLNKNGVPVVADLVKVPPGKYPGYAFVELHPLTSEEAIRQVTGKKLLNGRKIRIVAKTNDLVPSVTAPPDAPSQEDRVMTEIYTILRYLYGSEHQSESNVVKPESATAPRGPDPFGAASEVSALSTDRRLARSADLKAPAGSVSRDPLEWFDVPSEMGISLKTCKDLRMVHTYVREPEIATAPRGRSDSDSGYGHGAAQGGEGHGSEAACEASSALISASIDSSKFDGMVLHGPLEMQNPTRVCELPAMHPQKREAVLKLDWTEARLPRELKETVRGVGDVREEKLWDNASGVADALQKQRPTWLLVLTHGFLHPFKGYCAFPSSFGGKCCASWDILIEIIIEHITAPDSRLELVILGCCHGDYPAKQLQKSCVDVIYWPCSTLTLELFKFAKEALAKLIQGQLIQGHGSEAAFRFAMDMLRRRLDKTTAASPTQLLKLQETADVRLLHAKPPLLALCGAGKPGPQKNDFIYSIRKWEKTCGEALSFPDWRSLTRSANRVKVRVALVCFVGLAGVPKEEEELWADVKAAFPKLQAIILTGACKSLYQGAKNAGIRVYRTHDDGEYTCELLEAFLDKVGCRDWRDQFERAERELSSKPSRERRQRRNTRRLR